MISCKLEFKCTNNPAAYESLSLSLKKANDLKADCLKLIGDSEIITKQVCNTIHCLSLHLKNYQQEVWHLINLFKAFNIIFVPRFNNVAANTLANAAARFTPLGDGFSIEIVYKPAVLDNITNLRIFNDDQQILDFMTSAKVFKDAAIDEEEHERSLQEVDSRKGNTIPKGVVMLEKLFDIQNWFRGPPNTKTQSTTLSHEQINLGTKSNPKCINIGLGCSPNERQALITLFKRYRDIFAWTYDDLKTYDTRIIQHLIPTK